MTLSPFGDGIWTADHAGQAIFRVAIGTRMTVVRLSDGRLWLHSPIPLRGDTIEELRALGPVAYIVAPNRLHHFYLDECQRMFPDAETWLAPRLAKKRPDLRFTAVLGERPSPWAKDLHDRVIEGVPRFDEVVFLHPASRTLIVTDAIFNFDRAGPSLFRLALRLLGRRGPRGLFNERRLGFTRDDELVARSLAADSAWDFDNIILLHGDNIVGGGHEAFVRAYEIRR